MMIRCFTSFRIHKYTINSILLLTEFITLLYTFSNFYFSTEIIYDLFDALPAFTCARAIGNLYNISLGRSILNSFLSFETYVALSTILKYSL